MSRRNPFPGRGFAFALLLPLWACAADDDPPPQQPPVDPAQQQSQEAAEDTAEMVTVILGALLNDYDVPATKPNEDGTGCTSVTASMAPLCGDEYLRSASLTWTGCVAENGDTTTGSISLENELALVPLASTCETSTGLAWTGTIGYGVATVRAGGGRFDGQGSVSLTASTSNGEAFDTLGLAVDVGSRDVDAAGVATEDQSLSGSLTLSIPTPMAQVVIDGALSRADLVAGTALDVSATGLIWNTSGATVCCYPQGGVVDVSDPIEGWQHQVSFGASCGQATIDGLASITLPACPVPSAGDDGEAP